MAGRAPRPATVRGRILKTGPPTVKVNCPLISIAFASGGTLGFGQSGLEFRMEVAHPRAAALLVVGETGTGRNQAADDYVFLQAAQIVLGAAHRSFGEDTCGFLERSGGD